MTVELLSALRRPCLPEEYHLTLRCAGEKFTAFTKKITDPGWHEIQDWIFGKERTEKDDCSNDASGKDTSPENAPDGNRSSETASGMSLAAVLAADPSLFAGGHEVIVQDPEIRAGKTQPKKPYTENTLLSAMERAGSSETSDEAERKSLGTPTIRAGIIEKLVRIGFPERKGNNKTKYLVPTHKGISLHWKMSCLRRFCD